MNTNEANVRFVAIMATTGALAMVGAVVATASFAQDAEADAGTVVVSRAEARPSSVGPAAYFTGSVRVEPLFPVQPPARTSAALVTFEPGARSAWHTHPLGQTLIVTAGAGRVQRWGDAMQEIRSGDVVRIPPGQKHWHGAAPTSSMSHIALQETLDGVNVDWLGKVTDAQYGRQGCNGIASECTSSDVNSGWPNAMAAAAVAKDIDARRRIEADRLPPVSPVLLPVDEAAEGKRASYVMQQFESTSPGVVRYTTEVLFRDLRLRPDLAPRDRSLVTVSALVATGQIAQIPYRLGRAMYDGPTREEVGEILTQLAFYSGWPGAFSAIPVFREVFEQRPQ